MCHGRDWGLDLRGGFRREEEIYEGGSKEGERGGWIHYQELQIWWLGILHTYQPTTETSLSFICLAENCGTLWHKATT